mmetsp:Transcript_33513/g.53324  ORF Transcript_33513/g.53324 Transcript_33513/m.53324 type:complete len:226 (-) Transcript_33513:819-1496(-)
MPFPKSNPKRETKSLFLQLSLFCIHRQKPQTLPLQILFLPRNAQPAFVQKWDILTRMYQKRAYLLQTGMTFTPLRSLSKTHSRRSSIRGKQTAFLKIKILRQLVLKSHALLIMAIVTVHPKTCDPQLNTRYPMPQRSRLIRKSTRTLKLRQVSKRPPLLLVPVRQRDGRQHLHHSPHTDNQLQSQLRNLAPKQPDVVVVLAVWFNILTNQRARRRQKRSRRKKIT